MNFACANGLESRQKALTFRLGSLLVVGDCPIRQLILHTMILVGWFSWDLNPEVLGSLWLKASVIDEAGRAPFQLCPGIRLTTEEKHGKSQSGQPSSHRAARCAKMAVLRDGLGWRARRRLTSVTRVTSFSPRSAQVPHGLPD
jgi:hypothetical protein